MSKDLYVVNGGIGKITCFTSCLNKFEKINVMSLWPGVFENHPNVNFSYDMVLNPERNDTKFFNKFEKVHFIECYTPRFYTSKIHLVTSYREIMQHNMDKEIYNEIYFTHEEEERIQPLVSQLKNFVLVQFSGSEAQYGNTDIYGGRCVNRIEAQNIINILNFDLKLNVVNVYDIVNIFENTCNINIKLNYRSYAHLLMYAKGFIGMNSCLNHLSGNRFCNTRGVALWNDDCIKERFCYEKNINMYTNTPRVMRFNPNEVIENLLKVLK